MKRYKKLFVIVGSLPGFIGLLLTAVSINISKSVDSEGVKLLFKYSKIIGENLDIETSIIHLFIKISENAHWVITASIIWVIVFLFIWENQRRKDTIEKDKKQA